jgi:hypothetical protein
MNPLVTLNQISDIITQKQKKLIPRNDLLNAIELQRQKTESLVQQESSMAVYALVMLQVLYFLRDGIDNHIEDDCTDFDLEIIKGARQIYQLYLDQLPPKEFILEDQFELMQKAVGGDIESQLEVSEIFQVNGNSQAAKYWVESAFIQQEQAKEEIVPVDEQNNLTEISMNNTNKVVESTITAVADPGAFKKNEESSVLEVHNELKESNATSEIISNAPKEKLNSNDNIELIESKSKENINVCNDISTESIKTTDDTHCELENKVNIDGCVDIPVQHLNSIDENRIESESNTSTSTICVLEDSKGIVEDMVNAAKQRASIKDINDSIIKNTIDEQKITAAVQKGAAIVLQSELDAAVNQQIVSPLSSFKYSDLVKANEAEPAIEVIEPEVLMKDALIITPKQEIISDITETIKEAVTSSQIIFENSFKQAKVIFKETELLFKDTASKISAQCHTFMEQASSKGSSESKIDKLTQKLKSFDRNTIVASTAVSFGVILVVRLIFNRIK